MAALPEPFSWRNPGYADLPALAELERLVFPDPWPQALYGSELAQPERFQRIVLTPTGELAAYVFACWQVDELHILKVATHPRYQGKGLATALLEAAYEEALKKKGVGLILEVRVSNRRAIQLYQRLGYRPIGRRSAYYQDGEDAYVMYLSLPKSWSDGW